MRAWLRTQWRGLSAGLLSVVCLLGYMTSSCFAVDSAKPSRQPGQDDVTAVLRDEADGKTSRRAEILAEVRSENPRNAAANWHAGYTRWKDRWVKFDELQGDSTLKGTLDAYQKARQAAADTPASQMALADWCRAQGLLDQERIHLLRVLTFLPDHEAARARLGWKSVGGRWFTREELESARQQSEATAKAARVQGPQIKRAFAALNSRNLPERRKAEQTLAQFDDPALIPLLMQFFDGVNEEVQIKTIGVLDRMRSPVAAATLARIAIANPYNSVGDAAARSLRSRPFYDYVPALLSVMSSPVETRFVVEQIAGNQLQYRQVFLRETEERKEQLVVVHTLRQAVGRVNGEQAEQLANVGQDRADRVADVNAGIDNLNRCIAAVLETSTGQNLGSAPDAWWNWWYALNESFPAGDKPIYTMASYSATTIPTQTPRPRHECLVAGTPIWTITGARPVEQIQAGDLVLAQDPNSGEVAFKAVIMPTQRPAGPVVRMETERDTIRASGGHLFWVAGEGWVRARALQPGQRLHDIRGTTTIRALAEEADPVPTYNLIVADFHSYFVGEAKVLSHDNSIPRGTGATVPGLAAR